LHWDRRWPGLLGLSLASLALCATHYLAYAGLGLSLGVDYLLFGRQRARFSWGQLGFLLASQILVGGAIASIWNPFGKPLWPYRPTNWLADRLILIQQTIRDTNAAEFGVWPLLLIAPLLYLLTRRRNPWLVRLPLGIAA